MTTPIHFGSPEAAQLHTLDELKRIERRLCQIRDRIQRAYERQDAVAIELHERVRTRLRHRRWNWIDAHGNPPIRPCCYCDGTGLVYNPPIAPAGGHAIGKVKCKAPTCNDGWVATGWPSARQSRGEDADA